VSNAACVKCNRQQLSCGTIEGKALAAYKASEKPIDNNAAILKALGEVLAGTADTSGIDSDDDNVKAKVSGSGEVTLSAESFDKLVHIIQQTLRADMDERFKLLRMEMKTDMRHLLAEVGLKAQGKKKEPKKAVDPEVVPMEDVQESTDGGAKADDEEDGQE